MQSLYPVSSSGRRLSTIAICLLAWILLPVSSISVSAQQAPQQKGSGASQDPGKGDIGVQVQPAAPPADKKITPQEAQELFASIDDTLAWLSKDTGYAIKHKVTGELASREQVAKYVDEKMNEDEDAKRLERSEIVLKKFGLLPRDFNLHKFLIDLLQEQVAGYYDVKTKKMYLLDWLSADAQKPVLAHELTHALQDQNFNLKDWESPKAPKSGDREEYTFDEDEASTARSAVAEGQGMVTLVDYMLRGSGTTLAESPQVAEMMRKAMTSSSDYPLLEKAPLMIRESLVFPYGDGLTFESALLQRGKDAAFSGAFRRPPQDTHEVMDVTAYLHNRPAQWLVVPDLRPELGSKYEKYDEGSIGQLDTRILAKQYADESAAKDMAEAWRGGAYYAAQSKDARLAGTAKIGLLYLSRWDSDDSADIFAKVYADYVPQRYSSVKKVMRKDAACADSDCKSSYFFETDEGPVSIVRIEGSGVLVCEGFEFDLAGKLEQKLLTANPAKTVQVQLRSLMSPLRASAVIQEAMGRIVVDNIEKVIPVMGMH